MSDPSVAFDNNSTLGRLLAARSSSTYRLRVLSLAGALFSLLFAYLAALAISAATVAILSVRISTAGPTIPEALGLGAGIVVTAILTLALGKGLFRRAHVDDSEFIELTRDDEPQLFAFLDDICARCTAPYPDKVFACPNVNAGVFVETSLLQLFRRPKKHLLIGLGMINTLNRTELKAVLAHEFGHFSQRSMLLHDYVQMLTGILEEIIHGRDAIDRAINRWNHGRRRSLGIAWLLNWATTAVRKVAGFLLAMIRRLDASVGRQMELDADRLAVELTGSDALIHALLRTDWAGRCYSQTLYDLERAAEEDLRSNDVFFHQRHLIDSMRHRLDDPTRGMPPQLGDDETYPPIFFDGDGSTTIQQLSGAAPQDSHPSNQIREQLARRDYRRTDFDERSAWTLFASPGCLRASMTDRIYEQRWKEVAESQPAKQVQQYLDGEHAEVLLDPEDRAVYGHRFIEPGDLDEAIDAARTCDWSEEELGDQLQILTGPAFAEAKQCIARNLADAKPPSLSDLRPARHLRRPYITPHPSVLRTSTQESDRQWLADWDRRLLIASLCTADDLDQPTPVELVERYRFHLHVQDVVRFLRANSPIFAELIAAVDGEELDGETRSNILSVLELLYDGYITGLNDAPTVPALHGLPPAVPLPMLVVDGPLPGRRCLDDGYLDYNWLQQFVDHWQQLQPRLDHLRRKSLGALLLYQRKLHAPYFDDIT